MKKTGLFLIVISFSLISYAQNLQVDQEQGAQAAQMVEAQMGLIDDPEMVGYINEVGQRLVGNLDNRMFDYKFHLVDMVEPNAFAIPGGYIYVSRGILAITQNEHELAGVLAHEINHVHQRHSRKQQKRSILPGILMLPGAMIGAVNEEMGNLINSPISSLSKLGLASYSRKQEAEADELGVALAAKSGYDPVQLGVILERISREIELFTGEEEKFSYRDDHPFTPDRVKAIKENAKKATIADTPPFKSGFDDFSEQFDGLYIADNPAQGVFRGESFYQADLGIAFDLPEDWKGSNTPMYVGGTDPDGKGQLLLAIVPIDTVSTEDLAKNLVNKMVRQYRIESYKFEEIEFNEYKGHVFAVDEYNRGNPLNYTIAWFSDGRVTYQMICYGEKKFEPAFNKSIESMHHITDEEREKVTGVVMRVVEAKEGENISTLSKRTGNMIRAEFIALINDVEVDVVFKEGQKVRIGKQELYTPN